MLPIVPSQRRQGSASRRRRPRVLPSQAAAAGRKRKQAAAPSAAPPPAAASAGPQPSEPAAGGGAPPAEAEAPAPGGGGDAEVRAGDGASSGAADDDETARGGVAPGPGAPPASSRPRASKSNIKTTAPSAGGAGKNRSRRRIIAGPGDAAGGVKAGGGGVTFSDPMDDAGRKGAGEAGGEPEDEKAPGRDDGAPPEVAVDSTEAGTDELKRPRKSPRVSKFLNPSSDDENDPPPLKGPSPGDPPSPRRRPGVKRPRPDGGTDEVLTFETRVPRNTEMSNAQRSFLSYYYETGAGGVVERHERDGEEVVGDVDQDDGDGGGGKLSPRGKEDGEAAADGDGGGDDGGGKAGDASDKPLSAFCTKYPRKMRGPRKGRGKGAKADDPSAPVKEWEDDGEATAEVPEGRDGDGATDGADGSRADVPPLPALPGPAAARPPADGPSSDPLSVGPQVEFGPDGSIVVADSSLLPDASNRLSVADIDAQLGSVVVDEGHAPSALGAVGAGPASFATRTRAKRWTAGETRAFYDALRQCGTDFGMMELYFGGTRERGQLKRKYKLEQRRNGRLVDMALDPRRGARLDLSMFGGVEPEAVQAGAGGAAGGRGVTPSPSTVGVPAGSAPVKAAEDEEVPVGGATAEEGSADAVGGAGGAEGAAAAPEGTAGGDRHGRLLDGGGAAGPPAEGPAAAPGTGGEGAGSPAGSPREELPPATAGGRPPGGSDGDGDGVEKTAAPPPGTAGLVPLAPVGGAGARAKPRRARFKVKPKARRAGAAKK